MFIREELSCPINKDIVFKNESKAVTKNSRASLLGKVSRVTPFVLAILGGLGAAWVISSLKGKSVSSNQEGKERLVKDLKIENYDEIIKLKKDLNEAFSENKKLKSELEQQLEQFNLEKNQFKLALTACKTTSILRRCAAIIPWLACVPLAYCTFMFVVMNRAFQPIKKAC